MLVIFPFHVYLTSFGTARPKNH